MKEQIDQTEELARDIYDSAFVSKAVSISLAIDLKEKGWKKQSEGEWKSGKTINGEWGYSCSICAAAFTGVNAEWIAKEHSYCPKCGARMKGETDERAD